MACQDHTIESTLEIQRSYQSLGGRSCLGGFVPCLAAPTWLPWNLFLTILKKGGD